MEREEDRVLASSSVVAGENLRSPLGPRIISPQIPMRENTVSVFSEENFVDARASRIFLGFQSAR